MDRFITIFLATIAFSGIVVSIGYANPPASTEILKTIDQYWVEEEFSKIDPYIGGLLKEYPNYLPAEIADAIQAYRKGAQVEALVSKVEKIIVKVSRHLPEVPPNCFLELEAGRGRFQKSADWYKEKGYSKSWRMEKHKPSKMPREKRAKKWSYGFEMLFKICPAANFPSGRHEPVSRFHQDKINPKIEKLKIGELKQVIFDKKQPIDLRLSAVTLYVKKANSKEMVILLDCIELHAPILPERCAYEISKVSGNKDVLSGLLEKAGNPTAFTNMYTFWALVRLNVKDRGTLKKIKELAESSWTNRSYTKKIVKYLEQETGG